MEYFKFYSDLFVLVHIRINFANLEDMGSLGCTWNAKHVIGI